MLKFVYHEDKEYGELTLSDGTMYKVRSLFQALCILRRKGELENSLKEVVDSLVFSNLPTVTEEDLSSLENDSE